MQCLMHSVLPGGVQELHFLPGWLLTIGWMPCPIPVKIATSTSAILARILYAASPVVPLNFRVSMLKTRITMPEDNSATREETPSRQISTAVFRCILVLPDELIFLFPEMHGQNTHPNQWSSCSSQCSSGHAKLHRIDENVIQHQYLSDFQRALQSLKAAVLHHF